jgi:peptide/nickel transport system permease protein
MRIVKYLCRRAVHSVLLLVALSLVLFASTEMVPGEILDDLRLNPQISPATLVALRERYGLDDSAGVKYTRWVESMVRGEFGFSILYNRPVGPLLRERASNTLLLTVTATVLAWCLAVPIGAWNARRRGHLTDRASGVLVTGLLTLPDLLVALALLLIAVQFGGLPVGGMVSAGYTDLGMRDRMIDLLRHLVLPVLALSLMILPVVVRHVRASLIETLEAPFIQAARALGVNERRLVYRHAFRAAANPIVSLLGLSVASLLSASIAVEVIMSWPGMGPLLLEAIHARDIHLIVGASLASAVFLLAGNLLADGLLYFVDPRVRADNYII